LEEVVAAHGHRHQIEQMFGHGKGEAGLDHYEVRSYVGWHHHMTLSLLALWFLCLERLSQGKKRRP
jgi:SRSO17 transposase